MQKVKDFFTKVGAWIKVHVWQSAVIGIAAVAVITTAIVVPVAVSNKNKSEPATQQEVPHEHKNGLPTYVWADDNSSCTASIKCQGCSKVLVTETANSTNAVTQERTHLLDEMTTYTCEFTNTLFTKQTKEVKTNNKTGEHNHNVFGLCECGDYLGEALELGDEDDVGPNIKEEGGKAYYNFSLENDGAFLFHTIDNVDNEYNLYIYNAAGTKLFEINQIQSIFELAAGDYYIIIERDHIGHGDAMSFYIKPITFSCNEPLIIDGDYIYPAHNKGETVYYKTKEVEAELDFKIMENGDESGAYTYWVYDSEGFEVSGEFDCTTPDFASYAAGAYYIIVEHTKEGDDDMGFKVHQHNFTLFDYCPDCGDYSSLCVSCNGTEYHHHFVVNDFEEFCICGEPDKTYVVAISGGSNVEIVVYNETDYMVDHNNGSKYSSMVTLRTDGHGMGFFKMVNKATGAQDISFVVIPTELELTLDNEAANISLPAEGDIYISIYLEGNSTYYWDNVSANIMAAGIAIMDPSGNVLYHEGDVYFQTAGLSGYYILYVNNASPSSVLAGTIGVKTTL